MKKGFSLIELMIVIAIMAILATIAYPSYIDHVRKTKRAEAQAELLDLASKIQRYKVANFTFLKEDDEPITLEDIGESANLKIPRTGEALYNIQLSEVTEKSWILSAIPIDNTIQQLDGGLVMNHRGEKCWVKEQTNCVPSEATNWHER